MKKTYTTPKNIIIDVATEALLAQSVDVNNQPRNGVSGDAKGMIDEWEEEWD